MFLKYVESLQKNRTHAEQSGYNKVALRCKATLRLAPTADKTTITLILQINDYSNTNNIYISSKNLLMFTPRNRCNNSYTKFT